MRRIVEGESAYYEFTHEESEILQEATNELAKMTLAAVEHVVDRHLYAKLGIPDPAIPLIERSWRAKEPALCGRFDLAFDGVNPPKLLECDGDAPRDLREAAVVQQEWFEHRELDGEPFNSLHDSLTGRWGELAEHLPDERIDFCSLDDPESRATLKYLEDTAEEAGLETSVFPIGEIGWNGRTFTGPNGRKLGAVFKLYPWEWMVREEYGQYLATAETIWIEPLWKMLLSSKGILPVLWELYPRNRYLLEAHCDSPGLMMSWVKKPLFGRDGANVTLHHPGNDLETGGPYGAEGFVYQQLAALPSFDGKCAVVESWAVGHDDEYEAAGIGIREADGPITDHTSRFVPHVVE